MPKKPKVKVVADIEEHTSELSSYRRCRRRWDWASYGRQNYEALIPAAQLWFGSAFHFGLEDRHGLRHFKKSSDAFAAFTKEWPKDKLPEESEALIDLGISMLDYYEDIWLKEYDRGKVLTTAILNGNKCVEQVFKVPLGFKVDGREVFLKGRYDRLVYDPDGRLWVMDYKTAARINTTKLENDFQTTAYCYALSKLLGSPVAGMVYQQHLKSLPCPPAQLKRGGLSVAKNQLTSVALYKKEIKRLGLDLDDYWEILGSLGMEESVDGDKFVLRSWVFRSANSLVSFRENVEAQIKEMLSGPALYPNPTRDCSWCNFLSPCLVMEEQGDYKFVLNEQFQVRDTDSPKLEEEVKERLLGKLKKKKHLTSSNNTLKKGGKSGRRK